MTNGTVDNIGATKVDNVAAGLIKITYEGGEKTVTVPASASIVGYVPADAEALVKGAHVNFFAVKPPTAVCPRQRKRRQGRPRPAHVTVSPPVHSLRADAPERVLNLLQQIHGVWASRFLAAEYFPGPNPLKRVRVAFFADRHPTPGRELFEVRDGAEAAAVARSAHATERNARIVVDGCR